MAINRQTFSNAYRLFFGPVAYPGAYEGKRGAPFNPLKTYNIAPTAVDADGLVDDATGTELPNTETVTYTFPGSASPIDGSLSTGVLDVPRNVVAVVTHAASVVAMTILVTGKDEYGRTMSELLDVPATGTSQTVNGKKAFKEITSVAITSAADAEANTLNLGTGKVFGLPVRVQASALYAARFDNAIDAGTFVPADATSPATTSTGDVRGTFAPSGTPDGTKRLGLVMEIYDPSTATGVYGVTQV